MSGHRNKASARRLRFALLAFCFVLTLFAGRLFQIQGIESAAWAYGILIVAIVRMLRPSQVARANPGDEGSANVPIAAMAGVGLVSGGLSAVAGVGGGTVLVPAYHNLFRFPIRLATGTSSATIVLTSVFGVATYVASGWGVMLPSPLSLGYVDVASGLMLAVPAFLTSRAGVVMAHRVKRRTLALAFSAVASIVVIKLLYDAILA